jgi:DNA-binding LacI/PurR family transcriptional regulator
VQAVAAELGYKPNVAARNLALLRGDKQGGGALPIAWINQEQEKNHWKTDSQASVYFESARRRAAELGYHLEEIWTREPGMTVNRLAQIVHARGIEGVVFPVHRRFDFSLITSAWNDFALVGLNDHRLSEWVDVVCPDHYRNAEIIFREARRFTDERIGLALTAQFDAASNGLVHSCYLRHQSEVAGQNRVPTCFLGDEPEAKQAEFDDWLDEHQPTVVVTAESALVSHARAAGYDAIWLGLGSGTMPFDGGIDEASGDVAGAAIDCIVDKMRRFEKGVRESTRLHLLKSAWIEPIVAKMEHETVVA